MFNNGTFDYIGANTTTDHNFTGQSGSNTTINVVDGVNLSMSGNISTSGSGTTTTITKTGNGTLSLAGPPTITPGRASSTPAPWCSPSPARSTSVSAVGTRAINNGATVRNGGTGGAQVYDRRNDVTVNTGGTF